MKKFVIASLLLCSSLVGMAHQPLKLSTGESVLAGEDIFGWNFRIWGRVTTVRGSGGIPCGPGTDICSTTFEGGVSGGQNMPTRPGTYAAVSTDGEFCFYTPDATGNDLFVGKTFKQLKDKTIEKAVTDAFKMAPYTIKAGIYPIERRGKEAVIIFPKR